METEKYYFRVGAFFLIVMAAFVYYLVSFGGGQEDDSMSSYAIYFDNSVDGLARGAPVKLRGIEVGLVRDIRFVSRDNDRIQVIAEISDTAPIRKDTIAFTTFQGITGSTYLALENTDLTGTTEYLTKEKGEKYPVIRSAQSGFQNVLATAPDLMGRLAKTAEQAQKLLSDSNVAAFQSLLPEAHDALAEAAGAFREIKMLARTIRDDPSVIIHGTKYDGYKVQR